VIPPTATVTGAPDNLSSWHGYGLAVDVISRRYYWSPPEGQKWFVKVAGIFKAVETDGVKRIKWGGDWKKRPDPPHFQWAECPASPSQENREMILDKGVEAVWSAVKAV
jgi:peptidoglycan L-alanyl-D-glutamate endopeptidase CwlK